MIKFNWVFRHLFDWISQQQIYFTTYIVMEDYNDIPQLCLHFYFLFVYSHQVIYVPVVGNKYRINLQLLVIFMEER